MEAINKDDNFQDTDFQDITGNIGDFSPEQEAFEKSSINTEEKREENPAAEQIKNILKRKTVGDDFRESHPGDERPEDSRPEGGEQKRQPGSRAKLSITTLDILGMNLCKFIVDDFSEETHNYFSKFVAQEQKKALIEAFDEWMQELKAANEGKEVVPAWLIVIGAFIAAYSVPVGIAISQKNKEKKITQELLETKIKLKNLQDLKEKVKKEEAEFNTLTKEKPLKIVKEEPEARKRGQRGPDKKPRTIGETAAKK